MWRFNFLSSRRYSSLIDRFSRDCLVCRSRQDAFFLLKDTLARWDSSFTLKLFLLTPYQNTERYLHYDVDTASSKGALNLPQDHVLVDYFDSHNSILTVSHRESFGPIAKAMADLDAALVAPLFDSKHSLKGLACLCTEALSFTFNEEQLLFLDAIFTQFSSVLERIMFQDAYLNSLKNIESLAGQASYAYLSKSIAHEIKNPMSMLLSRAEILMEEYDDPDTVKEYAEMIKTNILRLLNVTETMLKYGNPNSHERSEQNIRALLTDLSLLAEAKCKEQGITLETSFDQVDPVFIDPHRIHQALLNIILNAVQAMPDGGTLSLFLTDASYADPEGNLVDGVQVGIQDTGSGIPQEILDTVFDPYYTTKPTNSGIGLSLTLKIIEDNGGLLDVQSTEGEGSLFSIFLPLVKP